MTDPYEQDIDQFGEFLRSIDEFFARKKPAFRDWYVREMVDAALEQETLGSDHMLLALKQTEKQRFVRLRDGTAEPEDYWPIKQD